MRRLFRGGPAPVGPLTPGRRLAILLCWLAVVVAYGAAVAPPREAPHLGGSDKLDHMVAFFTISFLARLAYRHRPVGLLLILIAAFGALIEGSQALPFVHRDAEWGDWIADVAATALGLTAAWPAIAWWDRRPTARA